jgi:LmbE family N-acetylglucosaminyl deacetylase
LYGHSDHVAIGELATEARRLAADRKHRPEGTPHHIARLFYPVISAQFVAELLATLGPPAQLWSLSPDHFHVREEQVSTRVDVTSVLDRKLIALRSHRSQFEPDNALRMLNPEQAQRFLGTESFRCADALPGDPITG